MRGLISTNYDIQSLDDMKEDLLNWQNALEEDIKKSQEIIDNLNSCIWQKISTADRFRVCAMKCFIFLKTSLKDIKIVNDEINKSVTERHILLLQHIGKYANELNQEIGLEKHQGDRLYIEDLEMSLYEILRNMIHDLIDLQALSERLKSYVGEKNMEKNWNKEGAIWSKRNAIIALVGIIIAILLAFINNHRSDNQKKNILKNNSIQAEQVIINNGTVNAQNQGK